MAFDITAGSGKTIAADVFGSAHNVSSGEQTQLVALATGTLGALALATESNPAFVAGELIATPSATFNRPADTTAYASADLVANSTSAGSVTPMSWTASRYATGSGQIKKVRLTKNQLTTTNATFRLHLYLTSPTAANGDNAAWSTDAAGYLGSFEIDMTASTARTFTDVIFAFGTPSVGSESAFDVASGSTIYGLLEARAAYTPASGETFVCYLEIIRK